MSTMYSLDVERISKHYAGTLLFDDISFSLGQGDVVAITGWNGSGKSTLVRIIAGLVRPSAGRVQMIADEQVIPKASRRRFLGLVALALSLYDELPGPENLTFFCKVRGVPCDRSVCLDLMEQASKVSTKFYVQTNLPLAVLLLLLLSFVPLLSFGKNNPAQLIKKLPWAGAFLMLFGGTVGIFRHRRRE